MSKYSQFIFESYDFDPATKVLELCYNLDNQLKFTETYRFDFEFADYDQPALDRAFQLLFFLAGVSYYKAYLPPQIIIKSGQIDPESAAFLSETYQKGLGEFWYVNQMDPTTAVNFPVNSESLPVTELNNKPKGLLVGIGGGKDSLVSVEILRDYPDGVTTWSLNHRSQLEALVTRIRLPHAWVERKLDPQLLELNKKDAYNGHIPVSAIFAATGTIVCLLTGRRDNVVSNEQSANEPTLHYKGVDINHQYSKSQQFEALYQKQLGHFFGSSVRYYSFLRPLTEVYIGELFARLALDKYQDVFSSCNRAFVLSSDHISWCGECPKCAFTFLALTPFVPRQKLEKLWGGKNLLLDPALEGMYKRLLGIEGDKPLDCVGEIKEARAAMELAKKNYPELEKYKYELPHDYNYRQIASHLMPPELFEVLKQALN